MNELTFNILKIVVSVATVFISLYVIPLLKEKLSESKYQRLLEMVEIAVRAAEQTIKGSGQGAVKKEQVLESVSFWMLQHGVDITSEQLDELIEAVVFNMNREGK